MFPLLLGYPFLLRSLQISSSRVVCVNNGVRKKDPVLYVNPERLGGLREQDPELQYFDEVEIYVKGGSGGHGARRFVFGKGRQHLKNAGGGGGSGGDVYLRCDRNLNTLSGLRGNKTFTAETGKDGQEAFRNGKNGDSIYISVPPGTIVTDLSNGAEMGKLQEHGERLRVARGGKGGRGNASIKGSRDERAKGSPPEPGEKRRIKLELQIIADIALVGVPNAGKSSILEKISNAKPKISNYPFTTLVPNLGVCDAEKLGFQGHAMVVADIPGLIQGAHNGTGLGRAFLRHIERCRIIIHILDGNSMDIIADLREINNELRLYSEEVAKIPQIVVLNKIDIPYVRDQLEGTLDAIKAAVPHKRVMVISAKTGENIGELLIRTRKFLDKLVYILDDPD